ncbi:MAG: hypothetical protein ACOYJH_03505 [Anaerovoracaceae bacterium]|jgi:hypothetical protein
MKKFIVPLLCAVLCAVCLTGCGAKYADSPYLGKWTASTASAYGVEISVDAVIDGGFTFDLNEDGSCDVKVGSKKTSGSWEETDNGFKVEDKYEFTVDTSDENKATMEYSGVTLTFERE